METQLCIPVHILQLFLLGYLGGKQSCFLNVPAMHGYLGTITLALRDLVGTQDHSSHVKSLVLTESYKSSNSGLATTVRYSVSFSLPS